MPHPRARIYRHRWRLGYWTGHAAVSYLTPALDSGIDLVIEFNAGRLQESIVQFGIWVIHGHPGVRVGHRSDAVP